MEGTNRSNFCQADMIVFELKEMADEMIVEQPALWGKKIMVMLELQLEAERIESLRKGLFQRDTESLGKGCPVNAVSGA